MDKIIFFLQKICELIEYLPDCQAKFELKDFIKESLVFSDKFEKEFEEKNS